MFIEASHKVALFWGKTVYVGLRLLKQECWIAEHLDCIDTLWMVGVGAAFDYHTGNAKYAPKWIQRIGMEWLYRLFHEPRMLIRNVRSFAFMFEAIGAGILGRRSSRCQRCSDNEHGLRHGNISRERKTTK